MEWLGNVYYSWLHSLILFQAPSWDKSQGFTTQIPTDVPTRTTGTHGSLSEETLEPFCEISAIHEAQIPPIVTFVKCRSIKMKAIPGKSMQTNNIIFQNLLNSLVDFVYCWNIYSKGMLWHVDIPVGVQLRITLDWADMLFVNLLSIHAPQVKLESS